MYSSFLRWRVSTVPGSGPVAPPNAPPAYPASSASASASLAPASSSTSCGARRVMRRAWPGARTHGPARARTHAPPYHSPRRRRTTRAACCCPRPFACEWACGMCRAPGSLQANTRPVRPAPPRHACRHADVPNPTKKHILTMDQYGAVSKNTSAAPARKSGHIGGHGHAVRASQRRWPQSTTYRCATPATAVVV